MECPSCKSPVPDGGTWCLYCGAAIKDANHNEVHETLTLDEAQRFRTEGLYREAISLYQRMAAAAEDMEKATIFELLGDTYREIRDVRNAIKAYRSALQISPTDTLRQKYDESLDQLRAMPSGPAIANAPAHLVHTAASESEGTEDAPGGLPPLEMLRKQLTPRLAALITGTAVMAVFAAVLFITKPWIKPYTPPQRIISITEQPVRTQTAPGSTTSPFPTPSLITRPLPALPALPEKGKRIHHVKQRTVPAPSPMNTPPAGGNR